jgi:protein TonB
MEAKKNPRADLEGMRGIFFMAGLVLALGLVLLSFNISSSGFEYDELEVFRASNFEEDEIQPTRQEPFYTPPPPPPPPQVYEVLNLIDNTAQTENEVQVTDQEVKPFNDNDISKLLPFSDEEEIIDFRVVEKMPEFPGGDLGLRKFIATNIKYPPMARERGIKGIVIVQFCVNSQGKVEKVSIEKGADPLLDSEAIRVVKLLPTWAPGEQRGRKVSVWYSIPINFELDK